MTATSNLRTNLGGNAKSYDQVMFNQNIQDFAMARPCEILFVDPSVSDLDTILGGLRPGVEAILLGERPSAARQIAAGLEGRQGIDAVHIIAHGIPGGLNFAAGHWSAVTLLRDAGDLSAIGRALGEDGD